MIPQANYAESTIISENLPLEVQVDLLMTELSRLLKIDDNDGIIELIPQIRSLDIEMPDSLYFLEARALFRTGDALASLDRLIVYLANTGRDGRFYGQATELLLEVKQEAAIQAQQREEKERLRQLELAESAKKARKLRIREAQRYLQQLGFRKATESGEINNPTKEALAIYQIRHGLKINGDVTDETLESLKAAVPDSSNCDALARYSRTPQEWDIPVEQIPAQAAVSACNDALRLFPEVTRLQIQYARSLLASGRPVDAMNAINQAAAAGYPAAETMIASMHEKGSLSEKGRPDLVKALSWYKLALEKDYPPAQVKLGHFRETGTAGFTRSAGNAIRWYRKAADQGFPPAQVIMGDRYLSGRGLKRDYAKAMQWFSRAAELGYPEAEYKLGEMHELGRGVDRDKTSAIAWYRKASNHGHKEATLKLRRLRS